MSSTEVTEVASGFCSDDLNVWILSRLTTCLNLVHQGDRDQRQHWGQHRKRSVFLLDAFLSFGLVRSEIGGFDLNAVGNLLDIQDNQLEICTQNKVLTSDLMLENYTNSNFESFMFRM